MSEGRWEDESWIDLGYPRESVTLSWGPGATQELTHDVRYDVWNEGSDDDDTGYRFTYFYDITTEQALCQIL
jgi:hypothetical protein